MADDDRRGCIAASTSSVIASASEAIQASPRDSGLLRRSAPRNDAAASIQFSSQTAIGSQHTPAGSRRVPRPSFGSIHPPLHAEGAGKAGRWPRPWPACSKKSRRQLPQVRPNTPGLPCAMVLTLIRDLLGDRLSCPHRPHARRSTSLASAPGCQDHTISRPRHAVRPRVRHTLRHGRVHRIPLPTSVTIAIRPLSGTERGHDKADLGQAPSDLCFSESIAFCKAG
jgi:hypothetical protein